MIRSALLLAFTATTLAAQSSFEGGITMSLTADNGNKSEMSYLAKNGKMRIELPGGRGLAIMDPATKKMQIVMTAQKMYMEMDQAAAAAAAVSGNPPKVVRTGKTEMIAGYKCEHLEVTGDDGVMTDVCMATGIGAFSIPSMGGRGGAPAAAGWQKALGDGGFPLKVTKAGKVIVEVTKIEKKSLDDALFTVPSDFTKFDMGGMRGRGGI